MHLKINYQIKYYNDMPIINCKGGKKVNDFVVVHYESCHRDIKLNHMIFWRINERNILFYFTT